VAAITEPEAPAGPVDTPSHALWWLLLITLGALALRLYRLGERPFWLDEAYSLQITDQPLSSIWSWAAPAAPVDPPLYFAALRAWRAMFGNGEAAVRSLSVVCGVALVPASYWLAAEIKSRAAGLLAAGLVAIAAMQIDYSQTARMYCQLALAVTLAAAATVHLARRQGGRWWVWIALVAGSGAALLTHFYGLFYVAGLAAAVLWLNRRALWSAFMRRWWMGQLAIVVIWASWIPAIPGQFTTYEVMAPSVFDKPDAAGIVRSLFETVGTGVSGLLRLSPASQLLTAGIGLALLFVGIQALRRMGATPRAVVLWELGVGVAIPAVLTLLVGPLVLGRTLVPAGVLVVALLAAGAMSWEGWPRAVTAGGLLLFMGVGAVSYSLTADNHSWDEAAAFVRSEATRGDTVVFIYSDGILPFELYYEPPAAGPELLPVADGDVPDIVRMTVGAERVFLVRSHAQLHDADGEAARLLGGLRPQEDLLELTGIDVYVFGPPG
jgi:4-amino-4-deoxy-L-arabinose transferase-like glycosyltransferase